MAIDAKIETQVKDLQERLDQLRELVAGEGFSFDPSFNVPLAQNFEKTAQVAVLGTTFITLKWTRPQHDDIERFEIYARNQTSITEAPKLVGSYEVGPAVIPITVSVTQTVIFYISTVLKNGLHNKPEDCPSVAALVEESTLDRFDLRDPAGTASSLALSTAGTTSVEVLNFTGAGRLIAVGVATFTPSAGAEAGQSDVWIDITIDGGTLRSIQIMDNDSRFLNTIMPWAATIGALAPGKTGDDSLMFPLNLTFGTSLLVTLRKTRISVWTGTMVLVPVVLYGSLS